MKTKHKLIIEFITLLIAGYSLAYFMILGVLSVAKGCERNEFIKCDTVYIDRQLTEWEMLQLALIEVESDYDSLAVSSKGAMGIMQIMPIYIDDVNRIIGTEYIPADAQCPQISLDCFRVINYTYNPEKDVLRAISIHNPKAGSWYQKRVLSKMEKIERREYYRSLLLEQR